MYDWLLCHPVLYCNVWLCCFVCTQVCFQLWLASSLMADSLAVACQTMLAKSMAAKDTRTATGVRRTCRLLQQAQNVIAAHGLCCILALVLLLLWLAVGACATTAGLV